MPIPIDGLNRSLEKFACSLNACVYQFSGVELLETTTAALPYDASVSILRTASAGSWETSCALGGVEGRPDGFDLRVRFELLAGQAREVSLGIELEFSGWREQNYVLMPAAVYNGNRFESRHIPYPPILSDPADMGPDAPAIISDVPRLNNQRGTKDAPGLSRIQQLTRDLATPAVGFHWGTKDAAGLEGLGFWLLTEQSTRLGDSGLWVEESADRSRMKLSLLAPGVRLHERYTIADMHHPCADRGADFEAGEVLELHLRLDFFDCPRVQGLFDRFVEIRKDLADAPLIIHQLPFSAAWDFQEQKYNLSNWNERYGYYAVGIMDDFIYNHWQTGWVGGLMSTYPLLVEGGALSRQRALRTFDYILPAGQDASGFFYGCGKEGQWFGDCFRDVNLNWLLIRKNADALYFLFKQFILLKKQDPARELPSGWETAARRCADAFVGLWNRYGQFGQFVDTRTGDILVGGSASAGIAPAGLALAWQYLGNAEYLRVAQESAQYLYEQFVQKGYTSGGPGEILQCPDSESAFGLLEALVVLYEVTGERGWLEKAGEQARQCFTWCVSYDFQFPPESTFGRLDMRTTGSVYANVQNKHSAPGICTLSGDALLKLFRATGDERYLDLLAEMAHNLPQYLSRLDRPIAGMPAGWMNERVEMSDWLEPVGEIFYGSCWCEVSNMLVYAEVPGLYVLVDAGKIWAIDHVQVEVLENSPAWLRVRVSNPTAFEARVKVFAETRAEMSQTWGQNRLVGCEVCVVAPGHSRMMAWAK